MRGALNQPVRVGPHPKIALASHIAGADPAAESDMRYA